MIDINSKPSTKTNKKNKPIPTLELHGAKGHFTYKVLQKIFYSFKFK
jgi:hypothetical protein